MIFLNLRRHFPGMTLETNFWDKKRILITGHTGFKGSWLTMVLNELGSDIFGVSLEPNTSPSIYKTNKLDSLCVSNIINIKDYDKVRDLVTEHKPEIIFHMAAQSIVKDSYLDPLNTFQTNVMGTVNLCEIVRTSGFVKAFINVTSDKCYKNLEKKTAFVESDELGGYDAYSASKACSELATSAYISSFFSNETRVVTARAGNVIGGGDWSNYRLIPDIFRSIVSKQELIIRYPNSVRPWQHVLEPLFGYLELAKKLYSGDTVQGAWNFGPKESSHKTVREVVDHMKVALPELNYKISSKKSDYEAGLLYLDISKSCKYLDWSPKWSFEKCLIATSEWYKAYIDNKDMLEFSKNQIHEYLDE